MSDPLFNLLTGLTVGLMSLPLVPLQGQPQKKEPGSGADPLPSWNAGPAKNSVVSFVDRICKKGSQDFVPASERIAVFDNDGTLWSEQPVPTQLAFAIDRIKSLAPQHPEWREQEPFQSILKGDLKSAFSDGEKSAAALLATTHAGMSTDEFERNVREWLKTARHPRSKRLYSELVYQPMLEVLEYLRENEFKIYIVSGGGVDFIRAVSQDIYAIPPEQVVGSTGKTSYEVKNGKPVLMKLPQVEFVDDGPGKPVAIHHFIGRKPLMVFGNSDGDFEMLQWGTSREEGPSFGLFVQHTDALREWKYDQNTVVGKLDRGLNEASQKGWTIVDMKKDWKIVYPFEKQNEELRRSGSSTEPIPPVEGP